MNFGYVIVFIFLNIVVLQAQDSSSVIDDTYADQVFIDNSNQFVEGEGVRMGKKRPENYDVVPVVEVEIPNQDIVDDMRSNTVETYIKLIEDPDTDLETKAFLKQKLSKIQSLENNQGLGKKKKKSYGMSFSDLAKATKKQRVGGKSSSFQFSFSDLAQSTRSKSEKVPSKNKANNKNKIKLPSK